MATSSAFSKVLSKANEKSGDVVDAAVLNGGGGNGSIPTPEEAAEKFIEVLKNSISSSGLSQNVIDAISNLESSAPINLGNNRYTININFAGDMSRQSLIPDEYDDIDNLAALYNRGVDHIMHAVKGDWHGKETYSRTIIPGAHFVQEAIEQFKNDYGQIYHVVDVTVDGDF